MRVLGTAVRSPLVCLLFVISAVGCSQSTGSNPTPGQGGGTNANAAGGTANSSGGSVTNTNGGNTGNPSSGGNTGTPSNGGNTNASNGGSSNPSGGSNTTSGGANTSNGGATNATGGATTTQADCAPLPTGLVTFSAPSGTFQGTLSLALRTSTTGAEIRYTTDHTSPTASSTLYSGGLIELTATTEIIAQAFVQGAPVGSPEGAVYIARSFDQMHDLPVIVLDSFGKAIPAPAPITGGGGPRPGTGGAPSTEENVHAAVLAFEPANGTTSLAAEAKLASGAGIHVRGQSSASYDKKPYRVELQKVDGSDRNCVMLGMPRESDWVLHSPFPDKALIRNAFVYSLGRDIGLPAPRGMFAEVYVNSQNRALAASDYAGVYLLVETIKNQKDRLNLQQLKETDTALPAISGGYIFQFQWQVTDIEQQLKCPSGQANCWNWIEVKDPKPWVQPQTDYLTQYLQKFVTALHSATPSDATNGYPAYMDTTSFANQVIIQELTRNLDAYCRSQYFYKDRDAKLFAGPLWDYDLTAGVGSQTSYSNMMTTGWQYESNATRLTATADWFPKLLADPTFKAALVARWKELRKAQLSNDQVSARITMLTSGLAAGAQRNFQKWNNLGTQRIGFFDTPTANTWEGQVAAMRDWLLARMTWLDGQWQ